MIPYDKNEMLSLQTYYAVFRNIRVNFTLDQCYHLRSSASRQKGEKFIILAHRTDTWFKILQETFGITFAAALYQYLSIS